MIRIRTPQISDLEMVSAVVHDNEGDWRARISRVDIRQMWTITADDAPIAIVGYSEIWDGVGLAWAVMGEEMPKYGLRTALAIRRIVDRIPKSLGAHRVEFRIRSGDQGLLCWAQALGFEKESTLKRYGPDKSDYDLMVRHY